MDAAEPESLQDRRFTRRSLSGSWFAACDLSGVVVRGSDVTGLQIDSPWLGENGSSLLVNGVDIAPFVDEQLNQRFPGRELRAAATPDGLGAAWTALEKTWAATMEWATSLPAAVVEASVDDEWSLAQTLRHLVFATDMWLGKAVLRQEQPYHRLGLPMDDERDGTADEGSVCAFADVVIARRGRQDLVRMLLAEVTPEQLREARSNPHDSSHEETVLSCVHTILDEEWEHHRYAVRDLTTLAEAGTRS